MNHKLNNPFLLSGYWSREYFCDRETELQWLEENFRNERNMVLYSWRRLGKTALIQCFSKTLQEKHKTETVYVDLMGTRDMASALKVITQSVHNHFGRTSGGISTAFSQLLSHLGASVAFDPDTGIPRMEFGLVNPPQPELSLHAIGKFLSSQKKKVVVALDEFQQINRYPEGTAEANFRSMMQTFPGLCFIFSGSHRNMMHSMFSEQNRPFYRSAQLHELKPIPEVIYLQFIQSRFQQSRKQIPAEIVHELYKWSRGQTYCIQLVCNKLFGSCTKVQPADLARVYREIIEQEKPVSANYSKLLTDKQWEILRAIAKEEPLSNPLAMAFIDKYNLGAASTVSTALTTLQQKELIFNEDGRYYIHDVLLAHSLKVI